MSIKVKKIIIVLILIVCFLIVSVAGVIVVTLGDSNYILNYINEDTYNKDVKTVKNIYVLFNKYKGEISTNVISKSINVFATKVLPQYSKINNPEDYFKGHKEDIARLTGITKEEEFVKVVEKAKTISNFDLVDYEFVEDTTESANKGTLVVVQINYKDNVKIQFLAYVMNHPAEGKAPIEYSTNVREKPEELNIAL